MKVDLILKNGNYLDCINKCFVNDTIAISNGQIIGFGSNFESDNVIDCTNKYIVPGFIDSHIHLESSIISPDEFLKIISLHGTTSLITDPHEITNVCGENGIRYILEKTKNMPVETYVMIPSCVPATPYDIIKEPLDGNKTEELFNKLTNKYPGRILGLAEMMNFPGVLYDDKEVYSKIDSAKKRNLNIDGHAPGVLGKDLKKYIEAGISSDHECSTYEEAKEKLDIAIENNIKFNIALREGTAAKNSKELGKLLLDNKYKDRVMLCTDDKHPEEFLQEGNGHIDYIIKLLINRDNINPIDAYIAASYNAAKHYNLNNKGIIKENYDADIIILDDLENVKINSIYKNGKVINQEAINKWPNNDIDNELEMNICSSINLNKISMETIKDKEDDYYQIIGIIPGQLLTKDEGVVKGSDNKDNLIKSIVFESHTGSNKFSTVYLKNFNLSSGAIGITVAHDSHYLLVAGTTDEDITLAVNSLIDMQGGMIYVDNKQIIGKVDLPIANLMTNTNAYEVVKTIKKLKESIKVESNIDPYMNLSFLSLGVIGNIKNLPLGPMDVSNWKILTQNDLKEKYNNEK